MAWSSGSYLFFVGKGELIANIFICGSLFLEESCLFHISDKERVLTHNQSTENRRSKLDEVTTE